MKHLFRKITHEAIGTIKRECTVSIIKILAKDISERAFYHLDQGDLKPLICLLIGFNDDEEHMAHVLERKFESMGLDINGTDFRLVTYSPEIIDMDVLDQTIQNLRGIGHVVGMYVSTFQSKKRGTIDVKRLRVIDHIININSFAMNEFILD